MGSRHLSRAIAMQSLYEWDFYDKKRDIQEILDSNIEEFGSDLEDKDFIRKLVKGVLDHISYLDKIITIAAPQWPLDQINIVERNILRLALYELLYADQEEVPPKVAINEAIELAKSFGGESSGKFVNGILGTVFNQLKEFRDSSKKKEENKNKEKNERFFYH